MHSNDTDVSQKRYKYVHKERDDETGLYYYGARYYAPWLCRFVSVDPLKDKFPYYTTYQYAGNKPINAIDLDGLEEGPTALSGPPEMQQYTPYLDEHQYIDLDELQGVGDFLYDLNALGYNLMIAGTYNTASGLINITASYAEASWVYGFEGGTLQLFESQMKAIKDSWVEAWDNTEFTWAGAFDSFTHVENYELAIGIILEEGVRGSLSTKSTPLRPPSSRHAPDLPSTKTKKYPAQQHYGSEFDGSPLPNRTKEQPFDAGDVKKLNLNKSVDSIDGGKKITWKIKVSGVVSSNTATLKNGFLSFDFNTLGQKGLGSKFFHEAMAEFGDEIKGIDVTWTMNTKYPGNMSQGLKQFWDYMDNIVDDADKAVIDSRLYNLANQYGFNKISNLDYDRVSVEFTLTK